MYEICKKQYQRKKDRGVLTHEYIEKQKIYLSIFLMNDIITQEEYQELIDYLNSNEQKEGE